MRAWQEMRGSPGHRRERLPEVEGGEAAVRSPGLADLEHLLRGGHLLEPVLDLDRLADPEVAAGEDVGPLPVEEEEHLRRPLAEAAHRDDLLDRLLVAEVAEPIELELTGDHVGG